MQAKIVIGCPSCSGAPPPGFTSVAVCDNCTSMIWLNNDLIEKKKKSKSPCWCMDCIKKLGNDSDVKIKALNWDEFCDVKKKAKKIGDDIWDIDLPVKWENLEEGFFQHAESINSEMLKHLESCLPTLCTAYMSKLKVYDDPADLGIACSLAAYVEKVLLDRREKLGSGFEGYTDEQKTRIFLFILGVRDAVDSFIEKSKGDDLGKLASKFNMNDFTEGLSYWHGHLKERHKE